MSKLILCIPILAFFACHTKSPSRQNEVATPLPAEQNLEIQQSPEEKELIQKVATYRRLLESAVSENGDINFDRIDSNRDFLAEFVSYVADHGPKKTPQQFSNPDLIKSYYLDAYNANAMYVALRLELHKNRLSKLYSWRRLKFYKEEKIIVDGQEMNLSELENDVVRPLGDARIHFALNCMAKGCPRLPRSPFLGSNINKVLDDLSREFFNDDKHCLVKQGDREVEFSEILDWYKEDFTVGGQTLIQYANRYRTQKIPEDYKVDFLNYDWDLNNVPQ